MSRPAVSVVMPFAGDRTAALAAVQTLETLETRPGDELIVADNSGSVPSRDGVVVVRADGERSPAHARNAGALIACNHWILFIDADCLPRPGLLDAYFAGSIAPDVGALAGEVLAAPDRPSVAARYGAHKSFLSQEAHLAHPYRPRVVAANLLVRRAAFQEIGGFFEGVRAAEDTDFSWRLQQAGWRLELRRGADVEHVYRASLRDLRRQWRGYAAGRAWLSRRYESFRPEPALRRALRRVSRGPRAAPPAPPPTPGGQSVGRADRARFAALDAVLAAEELAGLTLSNRPSGGWSNGAQVVLIADRFPSRGDPLVDFARTLEGVRIEAIARPEQIDAPAARVLDIVYAEDDGALGRLAATIQLLAFHPIRTGRDLGGRRPGEPKLRALAPLVRRLMHSPAARISALGGGPHETASRVAALAGRSLLQ